MFREIRARFSQGKIEPLEDLELEEGDEIIITVRKIHKKHAPGDGFERAAGAWKDAIENEPLMREWYESVRYGRKGAQ